MDNNDDILIIDVDNNNDDYVNKLNKSLNIELLDDEKTLSNDS